MYTSLKAKNVKLSDDMEIEGEVMLMKIHSYLPHAVSAIAKIAKCAGKFVCHFEVCSETDFFVTEVDSLDIKTCIRGAERKMLQKLGLRPPPSFAT